MAETIGVVSGVIGIAMPAIEGIEKLVDRCQNFKKTPEEFRSLKEDCEAVRDKLQRLGKSLEDNAVVIPEDIQRFKNDGESVKTKFETVNDRCQAVGKYFPNPEYSPSGCVDRLVHLKQALMRFILAGKIARECEEISSTMKDANREGTELHRFLHITLQMKDVKDEVKQVGERVKRVDKKADTIKKEVKNVGTSVEKVDAGVKTVDNKVDTILRIAEHTVTDANDVFKPAFNVPDLSREIILDFSTCDSEGEPTTMEGRLKRALLVTDSSHSEFSRVSAAVGAGGMGGVGKTNALIGLGWDIDVRARFEKKGGIYFMSFGKDAGVEDVIEELAHAVEVSGGNHRAEKVRNSQTLSMAIGVVVKWFEERETLFLCDDIWETEENNLGYFNELKQLLTSRGRSRMVLSTRDWRIAEAGGIAIEFGPRDGEGSLSRAILLKYAGVCDEDLRGSSEGCEEGISKILRMCGGIPLTLGVAGRAVKTTVRNCGNENDGVRTAIVIYAERLEKLRRKMMTEDMEGYPNFCATVRTSLEMVDEWAKTKGIIIGKSEEGVVCSDLFTRMSVFPRQSRVAENVVRKLWSDVGEEEEVHGIIDKLADLSLMSKREEMKKGVSVGLHDLVLEYCVMQAKKDDRNYHCEFLERYLTNDKDLKNEGKGNGEEAMSSENAIDKLRNCTESREWWSLSSDGYLPENVCWHMWKGGCVGELLALICDVRWSLFRMRSDGILGWQSDFESLESAMLEMKKKSGNGDGDEWETVESGMRLIREGLNEAWVYLDGNGRELGTQMYSRLFDVDEGVWPVRRYLRSIGTHCEKPWLLPIGRYWPRPGTSASVELLTGLYVNDIAMTKDGSVVAVGVGQDVMVMDIESRTILWRKEGHEGDVRCVAMNGDGSMIVSGSRDKTLRRWDGRSGTALGEPLRGHEGWVTCVVMNGDGSMIVSGSEDKTLRRWDGKSGANIGVTALHSPLQNIDIEDEFVYGWHEDGEFSRWRIDKMGLLLDTKQSEGSARMSKGADGTGGSDASSSWVVKKSSHQLIWEGPSGVQVLATMPSYVREVCFKRVSFRARGIGGDDGESSYSVGAVVAAGLDNGMVCIFHLVTE